MSVTHCITTFSMGESSHELFLVGVTVTAEAAAVS